MNNINSTPVKVVIAVLIVIALAEAAPEPVNYFLLLVLIGIILSRFEYFKGLAALIGTLGK